MTARTELEAIVEQNFNSLSDMVRRHARTDAQNVALLSGVDGRKLSYAQLDQEMDRVAAALQHDGFGPGDVLAICATASIAYAVVYLGTLRAGVAVAPLAPAAGADALRAMLDNAAARMLFVDVEVAAALRATPGSLPPLVALDDSHVAPGLRDWLAPAGAQPKPVSVDPDSPFNIIYSSGTTGTPKGIVQSHRMRWQHVRRALPLGYGAGAVTLLSTPLYSNTTLVSFIPTIALGGTVILMPKFDVAGFLSLAEKHRVTHSMLVPVQYKRIMQHGDFGKHDLSSFKMKFSTSAPFEAAVKADVLMRWPGGLTEWYGLTEGGGTCVLRAHEHPDKLHTVGHPMDGHDIRIIDEQGNEVAPGTAGEVVGRSPAMMSGYYKDPEKSAEAEWFDAQGERYIRTGDVGRFDGDGFLTLLDRKKDMIISGGFNVYPSDLEAALAQHEAVAEASVIGIPSERWGETPLGVVVLRPGKQATGEELTAWANQRLGKTQRLSAVQIAAVLPRSAIGKVLKRELRDQYLKRTPSQ
ncbi:MAG: class I adenylate-forming enzyme family protein [Steroidobacteraceae bacterium]